MSNVVFRTFRDSDTAEVQRCVDELYRAYPGEDAANPKITRTSAEFKRCPEKGRIVVFDLDQQVVGYAILVFFWSNEFGSDVIEIDELLVDSGHRGLGIASRFFDWIECSYPECAGLALQVSSRNPGALKLYEKSGFKPSRDNHMLKLLSPQREVSTQRL